MSRHNKTRENINLNGPISSSSGAGKAVARRANSRVDKLLTHFQAGADNKTLHDIPSEEHAYASARSVGELRGHAKDVSKMQEHKKAGAVQKIAAGLYSNRPTPKKKAGAKKAVAKKALKK